MLNGICHTIHLLSCSRFNFFPRLFIVHVEYQCLQTHAILLLLIEPMCACDHGVLSLVY